MLLLQRVFQLFSLELPQRPCSFNCNYPSQWKLKMPVFFEIILVRKWCENPLAEGIHQNHGNSWLTSTKTQVSNKRKNLARACITSNGNCCKYYTCIYLNLLNEMERTNIRLVASFFMNNIPYFLFRLTDNRKKFY